MIFNKPAQGGPEIFTDIFVGEFITDQSIFSAMKRSPYVAPLYINHSIATCRQQKTNGGFHHVLASDDVIESSYVSNKTGEITSQFPLFVLQDKNGRKANFDEQKLQELFSEVEQPNENSRKVYPEDIMDYIYASLHSPSYREKYKEFLKTDFPRVPRPKSWKEFWRLVELGNKLCELHLMHKVPSPKSTFPVEGSKIVEKLNYKDNKVYINETQYFDNVSELAWNFFIGGYQPAQKWLKDRKGRELDVDDILHYEKIIAILEETDRAMRQIG